MFSQIKKKKSLIEDNNDNKNYDIQLNYKIQYTVILDNEKISCLLKNMANQDINIEAFYIQFNNVPNNNIFKFVIGTTNEQSKSEVNDLRTLLEKTYISYNEKSIVQVIIPEACIGILEDIYTTLYTYVNIYSIYIGEKNCLYIESDDPVKMIEILKTYYDIKKLIYDKY